MNTVTVVIPTVGRWASLGRCVASLDQQTSGPVPTICVLNDVRSRPLRTLDRPWLRYIAEPRRSVGVARNAGAYAADSTWILFTDDDCVVPKTWLAEILTFLANNPSMDIAGGPVTEPQRPEGRYRFMRALNYMHDARSMKMRPGGVPSLGAANLLVRRSALLSLGGFDGDLPSTEDYELLVRAKVAGHRIGTYLNATPVQHSHETSIVGFCRRYWSYGRGVAAVVAKHRLDPADHRMTGSGSLFAFASDVKQFRNKDLAWIKEHYGDTTGAMRLWASLRAVAWQAGRQIESRRRHRPR